MSDNVPTTETSEMTFPGQSVNALLKPPYTVNQLAFKITAVLHDLDTYSNGRNTSLITDLKKRYEPLRDIVESEGVIRMTLTPVEMFRIHRIVEESDEYKLMHQSKESSGIKAITARESQSIEKDTDQNLIFGELDVSSSDIEMTSVTKPKPAVANPRPKPAPIDTTHAATSVIDQVFPGVRKSGKSAPSAKSATAQSATSAKTSKKRTRAKAVVDEDEFERINEDDLVSLANGTPLRHQPEPEEPPSKRQSKFKSIRKLTMKIENFKRINVIGGTKFDFDMFKYSGKGYDELVLGAKLQLLTKKEKNVLFTRTVMCYLNEKSLGKASEYYRALAPRMAELIDIDKALLLVFFDQPTLVSKLTETELELLAQWYQSEPDLKIRKFTASVEVFLNCFEDGERKRELANNIIKAWSLGKHEYEEPQNPGQE